MSKCQARADFRRAASRQGLFDEIHRRLLRAARNGERLHLEPEHARAIVASPLYLELMKLQREELIASWTTAEPAVGMAGADEPRAPAEQRRSDVVSAAADAESAEALVAAAAVISGARQRRHQPSSTVDVQRAAGDAGGG